MTLSEMMRLQASTRMFFAPEGEGGSGGGGDAGGGDSAGAGGDAGAGDDTQGGDAGKGDAKGGDADGGQKDDGKGDDGKGDGNGEPGTVLGGGKPGGGDDDMDPDGTKGKDDDDADTRNAVPDDPSGYTFDIDEENGFDLGEEAQQAYAKAFHEAGLTQSQVDAIVAAQQDVLSSMVEQNDAAMTEQLDNWVKEAMADPVLGKEWNKSVAIANKAVDYFADDEMKRQLESSGLGNHPGFIKMFHRLGTMMEDDVFPSGESTTDDVPAERSWYGKTTPSEKRT